MQILLTQRRLKPGSYDAWRAAWDSDRWPEGARKAYILRNADDPDDVIAFGMFDGDLRQLDDASFKEEQQARLGRMAPHIESIGADALYEVVEEVQPPRA